MPMRWTGPVPPDHPMFSLGPSIVLRDELPEPEPEAEDEQPDEDES
jgi:hypothetical protein